MKKNILITGASSGIGKALAEHYANTETTLILLGRNKKNLNEIQKICALKGANALTKVIDVTDQKAMENWLIEIDQTHPIDLVIANAGIGAGVNNPDRNRVDKVFKVNVDGVLNTVFPLKMRMIERKRGHIAVVSSLASFVSFPFKGTYAATKVAIRFLCDAWRIELEPHGICISVICPGFIKTPLTDINKIPMPMLMEANECAVRIAKGLDRKKALIAFPLPMFMLAKFLQYLPIKLLDMLRRYSLKSF